MQTLTEIRQLLAQRGMTPKHRLGQNFLHDKNQLARLLDASGCRTGDLVLEVGPGTGTLTEALLECGAHVIACEIDRDMAAIIQERLGDRVQLIQGDCLEKGRRLNPAIVEALGGRHFKLIANLPYQIASPLMTTLLVDHPNCAGQFVTIQKEVADRLIAKPGSKVYGPLTIIVQAFASVQRIATLSPSCFWPPPDVTSAMVAIIPHAMADASRTGAMHDAAPDARREFARFVTDLFTKRRKQLGTIFGRGRIDWPEAITADMRPDALSVSQILALWRSTRA